MSKEKLPAQAKELLPSVPDRDGLDKYSQLSTYSGRCPFLFPPSPPAGYTYRWVSLSIFNDRATRGSLGMADSFIDVGEQGWQAVPWSRHPDMPREGDWIIHKNQLLAQKCIEVAPSLLEHVEVPKGVDEGGDDPLA